MRIAVLFSEDRIRKASGAQSPNLFERDLGNCCAVGGFDGQ